MKQPIEPEDIRVGDLVRAEGNGSGHGAPITSAVEGLVTSLHPGAIVLSAIYSFAPTNAYRNWFLLDRPQPSPSKKAMVAADAALFGDYALKDIRRQAARRIDEAWAKEGLSE